MLVLSRKKNESIIINDNITIVVVEIRADKVRLGIEYPLEYTVHRNEVYEAMRRSQASTGDQPALRTQESIQNEIDQLRQQIHRLEAQLSS